MYGSLALITFTLSPASVSRAFSSSQTDTRSPSDAGSPPLPHRHSVCEFACLAQAPRVSGIPQDLSFRDGLFHSASCPQGPGGLYPGQSLLPFEAESDSVVRREHVILHTRPWTGVWVVSTFQLWERCWPDRGCGLPLRPGLQSLGDTPRRGVSGSHGASELGSSRDQRLVLGL